LLARPPSWAQRLSSPTVSAVATTAAMTDGTTEKTDETIGAIAAESRVTRWLTCPAGVLLDRHG